MPVLVAVGCSSSLGSLALRRFLSDSPATGSHWTVYAAHRSPEPPSLPDHNHRHHVEWIPLELESLASVQKFADRVTSSRIDLVWLNAAIWDEQPRVIQLGGQAASTREAVVNCIAQHYLVHLLADKLAFLPDSNEEDDCVVERARIVWTTSNLHKSIPTLAQIPLFLRAATPPPMGRNRSKSEHQHDDDEEEEDTTIRRPSTTTTTTTPAATPKQRYAASKAAQLVAAFYWRRHFSPLLEREEPERGAGVRQQQEEGEETTTEEGERWSGQGSKRRRRRPVDVVAVSPGFVPSTNLSRDSNWFVRWLMRNVVGWFPFAVSVEEGAARIARSLQMISTLTTASSSSRRSDAMDATAAAAATADDDRQQRQPSAPDSDKEGDSTRPSSQPDSNAAAASTSNSNSDSDSQALEALLRAIPSLQVLYLSLPSTAPLPSPHLSLGQTPSQAGSTQNRNQNRDEGKEEKAGSSSSNEYLVQGGAVGEWAARAGCDWDEVAGLGILPSREDLDRFAAEEEAVAEEEE